MKGKKNSKSSN